MLVTCPRLLRQVAAPAAPPSQPAGPARSPRGIPKDPHITGRKLFMVTHFVYLLITLSPSRYFLSREEFLCKIHGISLNNFLLVIARPICCKFCVHMAKVVNVGVMRVSPFSACRSCRPLFHHPQISGRSCGRSLAAWRFDELDHFWWCLIH